MRHFTTVVLCCLVWSAQAKQDSLEQWFANTKAKANHSGKKTPKKKLRDKTTTSKKSTDKKASVTYRTVKVGSKKTPTIRTAKYDNKALSTTQIYLTAIMRVKKAHQPLYSQAVIYHNQTSRIVQKGDFVYNEVLGGKRKLNPIIEKIDSDKVWLKTQKQSMVWQLGTPLPTL